MNRGLIAVVVLVLALGAGGLAWFLMQPPATSVDGPDVAQEAPEVMEPVPMAPPARKRVPIPRPEPASPPVEPEEDDEDAVAEAPDEEAPKSDTDRATDSDFPALQAEEPDLGRDLTEAMRDVNGDLVDCLESWDVAAMGTTEGRVTFAFRIDSDGLEAVDILDVDTVPGQSLDCFADVFWEEMDWPVTDGSVEVTWPIKVSVREDEDPAPE